LLETGMQHVGERVLANADLLAEQVAREPGWALLSRRDRHYGSGIVTFRHASGEHARILRRLKDAGVIAAERGGGIRLSPHFYHAPEQLVRVASLMRVAAEG
jgi:selenocysteine lyase/cysteine desulfurase